jgi:hypothetical protein
MIDTLESDLRSAMDSGSDHLELPPGTARQAWAAGRRVRPQQRHRWHFGQTLRRVRLRYSRPQLALGGTAFVIVAVVLAAFALGGSSTPPVRIASPGVTNAPPAAVPPQHQSTVSHGAPATSGAAAGDAPVPEVRRGTATTLGPTTGAASNAGSAAASPPVAAPGVAATRVVKTGSVSLTVHKGLVGSTIISLTKTATSLGGYVEQSRTYEIDGSPNGSLTLRIPVHDFEAAVAAATQLGHVASLSTSAKDVTGRFVDLQARLAALKQTRATYLTILSHARTIGQTLSVQQRVNQIQQQIEALQGELKVLRNQSTDATLTVDVAEVGAVPVAVTHHHRSGWSKAWHTSTGRFNRGIQTIIGGLGPLLLALILVGLAYLILRLVLRRRRRIA